MGLFQNPIWSNNLFLLQGYPNMCSLDGTCMRDVKDMGQQMGYRSLEWNWLKEAITYLFGQDFFCYSLYQTLRFLGLDHTNDHLGKI